LNLISSITTCANSWNFIPSSTIVTNFCANSSFSVNVPS
jgi:hypothetical protein